MSRSATVDEVTGDVTYNNWQVDQNNWTAETVPSVDGYTAKIQETVGTAAPTSISSIKAVTVNGDTKDTTIDVTYTANPQAGTLNFVSSQPDDQDGETLSSQDVTGVSDQAIELGTAAGKTALHIPAGWEIDTAAQKAHSQDGLTLGADGQPTKLTFDTDGSTDQSWNIYIKHAVKEETKYQTRQIIVNYIYGDSPQEGQAGQVAAPQGMLNIYYKRTGKVDQVTHKFVEGTDTAPWVFDSDYNENGYTNGYKVITGDWSNLPTNGTNIIAKIPTVDGYKAIVNGDWTKNKDGSETTIPANEFVSPSYSGSSTSQNSIAFTNAANEYVAMSTHTIYYVPAERTQSRTVKKYFKIYNSDGTYSNADVIALPNGNKQNYGEIKICFKKEAIAFATNDSTDPNDWNVTYGDWTWDANGGDSNTPGFKVISGNWTRKSDSNEWELNAPTLDGYTVVQLSADSSQQSNNTGDPSASEADKFVNDTNSAWCFRTQTKTFYVPNTMLEKTVTRTINITDPVTGNVTPIKQNVTFQREARIDNGTNRPGKRGDSKVVFGAVIDGDEVNFQAGTNLWNHKSGETNASGSWDAYSDLAKTSYTTLVDGTVASSVLSKTVTPDTEDATVNVTYIKNQGTITISHVEVDKAYTGDAATIPSDILHDITKGNDKLTWPTGAEDVTLDSSDFSFTDADGNILSSAPINVGTYHIILNDTGLNKFKSLDNNFEWKYDPETSYVTYKINKAKATAKLTGSNSRDYDGNSVSTADLNNGGNITVTIAIPNSSKTISYTLQDGDYTWSEGSAPSDAGSYVLNLNKTGILDHLKSQIADDVNWKDNVDIIGSDLSGSATFTINKADVSATFQGTGSKIYNGSALAASDYSTPVGVTITAPNTDNTVSLVAGTDYVWKKDNHTYMSAPVDAGTYTIELTTAGKNKIKAVNANNLNWTNDSITGTGTYTITKATATVKFAAGSGQTVDYDGETGQFDANKFMPVITTDNGQTLSIPSGVDLSIAAGDFTINGVKVTVEPTEIDNYTIGLSDSGFDKLQSATDNYNWINDASGVYTIQKATGG